MPKKIKIILLVGVTLCTTMIAIAISYRIGEVFFFDKLFYRKSAVYGYLKTGEWNALSTIKTNPPIINHRIDDLIRLISINQKETSTQILRLSTPSTTQSLYKIALIGDSFVYGSGIKNDERFGVVLEKKLNQIRPTKVYELALPGDSAMDNYAKYVLAQKYIQPDLYIWTLVDNDLLYESANKYPGEKELYNRFKAQCPQLDGPETLLGNVGDQQQVTDYYYPSFSPQYSNLCILKQIAQSVPKDQSMTFGFQINDQWASSSGTLADREHVQIMHTYANTFASQGIPLVTVSALKNFVWTTVSQSERHPSALTNTFFAQALFQEITTQPKWHFTR